jgi:hypothetical protein
MASEKARSYMMLAGTVIVAVMFVSAYLVSNNSTGSSTSTTTIRQACQSGPWVNDSVGATIDGYSSSFSLAVMGSAQLVNTTSSLLNSMVSNGLIIEVTPNSNTFDILAANSSAPYAIYSALSSSIGANAITGVSVKASISLPSTFVVSFSGSSVRTAPTATSYLVPANSIRAIGSLMPVKVLTLLTSTGGACGNMTVTYV